MKRASFYLAVLPLSAGVRIETEVKDLASGRTTQQVVMIDAERMRIDSDKDPKTASVLFLTDGGRNRLVILNRAKNEYSEIDEQTAKQLVSQVEGAMAMMQEQLKNMPPEQRAMMEKMMKGKMGGMAGASAPGPQTVFTAKGSSSANGFACTLYEGTRGGEKVSELCAAQPGQLKVSPGDMKVFEKMAEFAKSLSGPLASMAGASTVANSGVQGYPVTQTMFRGGQAVSRHDLKTVQRVSFSDADFSVGSARKVEFAPGRMPR